MHIFPVNAFCLCCHSLVTAGLSETPPKKVELTPEQLENEKALVALLLSAIVSGYLRNLLQNLKVLW